MKAVERPCEVTFFTDTGTPRVIHFEGHTYHLTKELNHHRAGGRWWLGEPSRDVWVLACGDVTLEICQFEPTDRSDQPHGWWILRIRH